MADVKGPYLILAAFWSEADITDEVAEVLRTETYGRVDGYLNGAVVAFRHEVADSYAFRRDLARFDLAELNERPIPEPDRDDTDAVGHDGMIAP